MERSIDLLIIFTGFHLDVVPVDVIDVFGGSELVDGLLVPGIGALESHVVSVVVTDAFRAFQLEGWMSSLESRRVLAVKHAGRSPRPGIPAGTENYVFLGGTRRGLVVLDGRDTCAQLSNRSNVTESRGNKSRRRVTDEWLRAIGFVTDK